MESLGQKLKSIRKQNKMTQSDVANFLSISYVAYGDYERGKALPDVYTIKRLALLFHVTTDFLLDVPIARVHNDELIELIDKLYNMIHESNEVIK